MIPYNFLCGSTRADHTKTGYMTLYWHMLMNMKHINDSYWAVFPKLFCLLTLSGFKYNQGSSQPCSVNI
jgi:hypothetical protein